MMRIVSRFWPILAIVAAVIIAFYPAFFLGKIPLNGNNLVSFFSPWIYQKWAGFPTGVPAKPGMLDQLRLYYPYMNLTQQSYRLGQIPLWNPYNFAGNPHMAEWQSGVFYPLHLLLPFVSLPVYWTFYQIVGISLAGIFTFWYLRNLTIGKLPSVFGALTFTFSTFMFTWNAEVSPTTHSILWLPLMLLLVDKFIAAPRKKYWLGIIASGVASILSGYWQTTFYVLVVVAVYMVIRSRWLPPKNARLPSPKTLIVLLTTFVFIVSLTAYQVLPTIELYQRSSRQLVNLRPDLQEFLQDYLLKPPRLITLLAPDFFGHPTTRNNFSQERGNYYEWALFVGTIQILILPLVGLHQDRQKKRLFWFFAALGALVGSFAFDLPHSRLVYSLNLPLLSTGIANRILFVPAFALSVMTAIAFEAWLRAKDKKRQKVVKKIIFAWMLFFIFAWLFLWLMWLIAIFLLINVNPQFPKNWYIISQRNLIIPTIITVGILGILALVSWRKKLIPAGAVALVIIATSQNLYQFHKFTPFTEKRFIYPAHATIDFLKANVGINRFLGYNGVFLKTNFATQFNIFTVEGYDSLNDFKRSQLLHAAEREGKLAADLRRSADATLSRDLQNPRVLRLMQLAGIKYLVDHPEFPEATDKVSHPTLPENKQKLVFSDDDWNIYEYADALPRAFFVGTYIIEANEQRQLDWLFNPITNLRESIVLSEVPSGNPQPDPTATVSIASYTPNKIIFSTKAQKDQLLFLSDTYYPGWRAKVDGLETPVLRANFAFRAVPIPAGTHHVEMYYLPETFIQGVVIAAITLLSMGALVRLKQTTMNKLS